jgi:hypothetical protein
MTDLYTAATDTIPGVRAIRDAVTRLAAHQPEPVPTGPTTASLADHLSAGGDVPHDLAEQIAAAVAAQQQHQRAVILLRDTRDTLTNREALLIRGGADMALSHLRAALAALVEAARPLADHLADVRTADEAVDANDHDTLTAWRNLVSLEARYADLLTAQTRILRDAHLTPPNAAASLRELVDSGAEPTVPSLADLTAAAAGTPATADYSPTVARLDTTPHHPMRRRTLADAMSGRGQWEPQITPMEGTSQ